MPNGAESSRHTTAHKETRCGETACQQAATSITHSAAHIIFVHVSSMSKLLIPPPPTSINQIDCQAVPVCANMKNTESEWQHLQLTVTISSVSQLQPHYIDIQAHTHKWDCILTRTHTITLHKKPFVIFVIEFYTEYFCSINYFFSKYGTTSKKKAQTLRH